MKILFFAVLLVFLTACEPRQRDTENLPWKTSVTDAGATHVFGVNVGEDSLKQVSISLQSIAETALFENDRGGALNLESYFGKVMIGLLEGRIVADLDATAAFLKTVKEKAKKREATPNNNWKYKLDYESSTKANEMKVWRLVYMPTGQYEEKQIKFFGVPEETIKVTETAQYRLFPSKGMAVLWDTEGGEIFYYVAPRDFARLQTSLPMEIVQPKPERLNDE